MEAYTKGISKEDFVSEMKMHQAADNFLKGTYDDGDQACSVGCALKSVAKLKGISLEFNEHKEFENHLGIPEWMARLNDAIFEGVSLERSKLWPVEFAEAINDGSDLDKVKTPFLIFILKNSLASIRNAKYDQDKFSDVKNAIDQTESAVIEMIRCHENGLDLTAAKSAAESAKSAAKSAAWSAAESAESAAWSAAWSAESARSAAWSAKIKEYSMKFIEYLEMEA